MPVVDKLGLGLDHHRLFLDAAAVLLLLVELQITKTLIPSVCIINTGDGVCVRVSMLMCVRVSLSDRQFCWKLLKDY